MTEKKTGKPARLVAFTGKPQSGKSTAVEYFIRTENRKKKLVKFAQPLYDIQEFIYAQVEPVFRRPDDFEKDRKLLQWLGTEWGRETISQNVWVDLWKAKVTDAMNDGYLVFCDDCRFDNEAQVIKELGGTIIRILRDDQGEESAKKHSSEKGISDIYVDVVIENNGTFEEYYAKLTEVFRGLEE